MPPPGWKTTPPVKVSAISGVRLGLPEVLPARRPPWPLKGLKLVLPAPMPPKLNSSLRLGARMSRDWVARRRRKSTGSQVPPTFQVVTDPEVA